MQSATAEPLNTSPYSVVISWKDETSLESGSADALFVWHDLHVESRLCENSGIVLFKAWKGELASGP